MNQTIKSFIEPFPHKIAEISELLSSLSQEEQAIKANRRNRDVRQQHERQAENLRRKLLAQADYSLLYNYMEATGVADKNAFRTTWQQNLQPVENIDWLEFVQSYSLDLASLPFGSFYIRFKFKLLKPYISRDDNQFYIVDNPIVREKVFRLPMVRSTAWKGSLRHVLWQLGHQKEDAQIKRLFGTANDDQPEKGNSGHLYFYPSFFTKTSLEIINPHDRERRVGKNPILIESVPVGAGATFTLLYVPLDRAGKDEAETRRRTFADLQLVAEGLKAMFTVYGFGAKTSSGYGVADGAVKSGKLALNIPDISFSQDETEIQTPENAFLKYMDDSGLVYSYFEGSGDGGLLSNREYKDKGEQYGGGSLSEFKEFRRWYIEYGKQWQKSLKTQTSKSIFPTLSFEHFDQLIETLRQMGGDACAS